MTTIIQYLENFYDRYDVISDLKPYLKLLQYSDIDVLRNLIRQKLESEEVAYANNTEKPPNIKMIRLRIVDFKLNKLTGSFFNLDPQEKLKLVNTIVQTYLWAFGSPTYLTENDRSSLDDIIIVAAELLYEVNIFEWSVLNPINFMLISILELALTKNPNNNSIKVWLMKILGKLGLSSRFAQIGQSVKDL